MDASTSLDGTVERALDLLSTRAYYAAGVDWPVVTRNVAEAFARGADLAQALSPVWRALGDRHSHLRPPAASGDPVPSPTPTGHLRGDGLGHIVLPGVGSAAVTDCVTTAWDLLRRPAVGWIADLRGNGGGSVVPMLMAVGPLLGTGGWLRFRRRVGTDSTYRYEAGALSIGARRFPAAPCPDDAPGVPVGLLADHRTASGAEAVLVAFQGRARTRRFGTPTAGVPTGNVGHRLPDGSVLLIMEALAVDRTGRVYDGALAPDDEGGPDAAAAWLLAEIGNRCPATAPRS